MMKRSREPQSGCKVTEWTCRRHVTDLRGVGEHRLPHVVVRKIDDMPPQAFFVNWRWPRLRSARALGAYS